MLAFMKALLILSLWLGAPAAAADTFKDCTDCPVMVAVPAGPFDMGAAPEENIRERSPERYIQWETPVHRVTIAAPFAVGVHEITRGQFAAFVRATDYRIAGCDIAKGSDWEPRTDKSWLDPNFEQDDSHPVVCVNWHDAQAYVRWLSARTGKNYRLLTEAEWEYVARAGTTAARYWGDGRAEACRYANVPDQSHDNADVFPCNDEMKFTAPVGSFAPNAWGLHDTIGNVWEWVVDCFHDSYTGAPADGSAWDTDPACQYHVGRSGSWNPRLPSQLRAAARGRVTTTLRNANLGFRVAMTLPNA
ncbi:MAG: formylglycine-generating enzyme family protein [Alphaproteobacteria bacterium]|nr:formylglycine-generating enzyme family protein [Alphaproteobacteria bacterium]